MMKLISISLIIFLVLAIVFLPVMGYSFKSNASPYPFSINAEDRPPFTLATGSPAHGIVPGTGAGIVAPTYSIGTGKPYQYSIQVTPTEYSFDLATSTSAPVAEAPVVEETREEPPMEEAPVGMTYTISGTVYDDTMTGLAGWTVNLEQPAGTIIANTTTTEDGTYAFAGQMAGEYLVSVVAEEGWEPVDSATVTVINGDVTQDFAATMVIVVAPPVEQPPIESELGAPLALPGAGFGPGAGPDENLPEVPTSLPGAGFGPGGVPDENLPEM